MSSYLITLWNKDDTRTCFFMPVGKNGKKRKRPQPVKLTLWDKLKERVLSLWEG